MITATSKYGYKDSMNVRVLNNDWHKWGTQSHTAAILIRSPFPPLTLLFTAMWRQSLLQPSLTQPCSWKRPGEAMLPVTGITMVHNDPHFAVLQTACAISQNTEAPWLWRHKAERENNAAAMFSPASLCLPEHCHGPMSRRAEGQHFSI